MPFIPHTPDDIQEMLAAINVSDIETLFEEIPADLRCADLEKLPPQLTEFEISRLMHIRAGMGARLLCFAGAGAYDHHVPAAVWEITTRGEFYSAYTPYQAEASQGSMQVIYEYQSMMAQLTAMDVSNASLYDGASALAEAVLMAVRCQRKSKSRRILMPSTVHPVYRQVVNTIVRDQGVELVEIPYCSEQGRIVLDALKVHEGTDITAVVIPQPNYFGALENVDQLTDWAHAQQALVIALVNPLSLALLEPPGEWGEQGADIACGEGQPLGIPLSSGGPYFGLMTCKQEYIRQMPGRLVGRTVDTEGNPAYALTLQAREQHIRRSKATSNICTNQGLMVTAATIHMAIMGAVGLRKAAAASHSNTRILVEKLTALEGVERVFSSPFFHEQVLRFDCPVERIIEGLESEGIQAGINLNKYYPELGEALLVCATEVRTLADINRYVVYVESLLQE